MKRLFQTAYLLALVCSVSIAQDRVYWGDQDSDVIGSVLASNLTSPLTPVSGSTGFNPSGIAYSHSNPTYPLFYASGTDIFRHDLSGGSNTVITTSNQFNRGLAIDY